MLVNDESLLQKDFFILSESLNVFVVVVFE